MEVELHLGSLLDGTTQLVLHPMRSFLEGVKRSKQVVDGETEILCNCCAIREMFVSASYGRTCLKLMSKVMAAS